MSNFEYKVYDEVLEAMKSKTKDIEVRLYNEKSSKIRIGDIIKFKSVNDENKCVLVKVENLIIYEDVKDFLDKFGLKMATKTHNKENALDTLYNIFGKEEVDTHKLIGICFESLNNK